MPLASAALSAESDSAPATGIGPGHEEDKAGASPTQVLRERHSEAAEVRRRVMNQPAEKGKSALGGGRQRSGTCADRT